MKTALIAVSAGIVFGLLAGFLVWSQDPAILTDNDNLQKTVPSGLDPIVSEISHEKTEIAPSTKEVSASKQVKEKSQLFSQALIEYFNDKFMKAWNMNRSVPPGPSDLETGEKRFREAVLLIPAELAKIQSDERNKLDTMKEAIAHGGGVELLKMTEDKFYKPDPNDTEWEIIDHCCTRRANGDLIDGTRFIANEKAPLETGITLFFPRGVHLLDERRLRGKDRSSFPSDIMIKGDGMDATLLQVGNISPRSNIERLALQDLTLDLNNDGLFDVRRGAIIVDLQRVRIVSFDAGHGGCNIFSGREGCLVRAQNSAFLGGYGKSPGNGELFDRSPVLARFVNCQFDLIDLALKAAKNNGRISFHNCSFTNLDEDPMIASPQNVDFHNCVIDSILPRGTKKQELKKDLGDLFYQLKDVGG